MENEIRLGYNYWRQCKKEWKKLQAKLKNINKGETSRFHHPIGYKASGIELHVFCDASEKPYGALAYLKF